jgi:type IV pilus assembly protein PilC
MPIYIYHGRSSDGQPCTGELTHSSVSEAVSELESQGLQIDSISAKLDATPAAATDIQANAEQRPNYLKRLDGVLAQSVTTLSAMEIAATELECNDAAQSLCKLSAAIRNGLSSEAFLREPELCALLPSIADANHSSGSESVGQLEPSHPGLLYSIQHESVIPSKRSLIKQFSYPIAITCLAVLLFVVICVTVVPIYSRMFSEFDLRLSAPTKILFNISYLITTRPWIPVVVLVFGLGIAFFGIRLGSFIMQILHGTTIFGWVFSGNNSSLIAMSKFTGVLGELIRLGAPVPEAIRIAGKSTQHMHFEQSANRLAREVDEIELIHSDKIGSDQLVTHSNVAHCFPKTVVDAIHDSMSARQEPSDSPMEVATRLREISLLYRDRASERNSSVNMVLGPLSIVATGFVIGLCVFALFLPLISLVIGLSA